MPAVAAFSASGQIIFDGETADFGMIKETDGPKTIRIYVKNSGTEPTAIKRVRPTCGCTAATFMQEEFAPGSSAWIDLTYDPSRRPGHFEKGVKVFPVDGEMIRIPISGTVLASPQTIAAMYPVDAGLLHLSEKTLMTLSPLGKEERTLYIDVYNSGDTPVWFALDADSDAVTTQDFGMPIGSGEKGLIGVYINPAKETRTGKLEYTLQLYTSSEGPVDTSDTPGEGFEIKVFSEKN